MPIALELNKPGQKVQLNLSKNAKFTVELSWDSDNDPDVHALLATNSGNGAKINAVESILSTYNCKKTNATGVLAANADGSFSTPCGGLRHSGDCRNGIGNDVDESITIDTSRVAPAVNEIPIFVTIHPSGKETFSTVKSCKVAVKDDGGSKEYELTKDFATFNAVQVGSVCREDDGRSWSFYPIAQGFNGDFNKVLEKFS